MSSPERQAAEAAIVELEHGRSDAALKLLRGALSRGGPPKTGPDHRPADIVQLRAYIEQAAVELEHGEPTYALPTLRRGIAHDGASGSSQPR